MVKKYNLKNIVRKDIFLHWYVLLIDHRTHSCTWHFYRPQTKLQKGNVFTPVCQSFCSREGVCLSACWDTPPWADSPYGQTPQTDTPCPVHAGIHPPCPVHSGIDMATAADGMHPTGMHSCSCFFYFFLHFTIATYYSVAKLQAQVVFKKCCIEIPH